MEQTDGAGGDMADRAVIAARVALETGSVLDVLFLNGQISEAAFVAGSRFAAEIEALDTTSGGDNAGVRSAPGPRTPPQRKLIAAGRIREVRVQLGDVAAKMLAAVVSDNRSFRDLGREMHISKNTAKSWFMTSLDGLAAVTSEWR
jgi:hypothetical protein